MTRLVSEPTPANLISTMSPGVTDTNLFDEPLMITSPPERDPLGP